MPNLLNSVLLSAPGYDGESAALVRLIVVVVAVIAAGGYVIWRKRK